MIHLLVTGASGMIGSRFLRLLPSDFQVEKNIDRTEGLDILDLPVLSEALSSMKADAIVHFAAFTDVNAAAEQEGNRDGLCFQINVVGTKNVIELARRLRCRLLHVSTDYVFDGVKQIDYVETDEPHPIEWYGTTKYEAEKLVMNSSIDWCIARTSYPFQSDFPGKLDLVRGRLKRMKENDLPPQFTDHIITPTFVDQLAAALAQLLRTEATGVYHLVGDTSLSDYDLSVSIAKQFSFDETKIAKSSLSEFNKSAPRPYQQHMALSNNKFETQFGDTFSSFAEALSLMKAQMKKFS